MSRFDIPTYITNFIEEFNRRGGNKNNPVVYYEQAVYFAMDEVRLTTGVVQLRVGRHDFYYSATNQLGLFLRACRLNSTSRNTNRRAHPHDLTNGMLACSTADVQAACGAFLSEYPSATFVCAIGVFVCTNMMGKESEQRK